MATITKRNNTFQIVVSLGYDVNGKKIRKTTTFRPPENVTEKKAEKLAREFAHDFEQRCKGMTELKENMRFSDLVEWYFDNYAPNELKPVTAYTYRGVVNKHILPVLGNTKLKDFSSAKLTAFFQKSDLTPANCRKVFIILRSIFKRAEEQGFIKETPCKNVILPKDKRTKEDKKPPLEENQVKQLLEMVEGYSQFNTIIKVLLYTGMRSGECLGLQWEDIDFDNNMIHIQHNLADVGGKHWLDTPKTAGSVRYIGMSSLLKDILLEHKAEQDKKKAAVGRAYLYPTMVFTTELGNYVDRSFLNTQFKKFVAHTDFSYISLHSLRHCNATLLINSGVDLKIVSELLGHSDVSTTANIYADVLASSKAKVAELISLKLNN